ncbi:MAG: hypothetical protein RR253_08020, partial [Oscillospiraceae bacterium]
MPFWYNTAPVLEGKIRRQKNGGRTRQDREIRMYHSLCHNFSIMCEKSLTCHDFCHDFSIMDEGNGD